MYGDLDNLNKANRQVRVRITEVNMAKQIIWASGRGAKDMQYQITIAGHDPFVAIPKVGEQWIIQGNSDHTWRLFKRIEDGSENVPTSQLRPGDRRIDGSMLYIDTERGTVANTQITFVDQEPHTELAEDQGGQPFLYRDEGPTLLSVNGELIVLTSDGKRWRIVLEPYELP